MLAIGRSAMDASIKLTREEIAAAYDAGRDAVIGGEAFDMEDNYMERREITEDERKRASETWEQLRKNASDADIRTIESDLPAMKRGPIAQIWDKVRALWKLIGDPEAAWGAKATAIGALIYLIMPVDAVPDVIPIVGLLDDAGVIGLAVVALTSALDKYSDSEGLHIDSRIGNLEAASADDPDRVPATEIAREGFFSHS